MKPDWSRAPDWATHRAMDADGAWNWFECQPKKHDGFWRAEEGRIQYVDKCYEEWADTLEARPEKEASARQRRGAQSGVTALEERGDTSNAQQAKQP